MVFKELDHKTFSIEEFFKLYKQLFYEIPKKGIFSHKKIVETSLEYIGQYIHPKNRDIHNLYLQLKSSLEKLYSIENTHSIIQNNSLLKEKDSSDNYYYIQSFKKRRINPTSGDIDQLLKEIKEYKGYPKNADIIYELHKNTLNNINTGLPIRSIDDIKIPIIRLNIGTFEVSLTSMVNNYGSVSVLQGGEELDPPRGIS